MDSLFLEVKDILRITWDDEDQLIINTIDRGKHYLEELAGVALDFDEQNQARSLLLNYCRYAYNNALEYFDDNFSQQILRLQMVEAIKDARQKNESESGKSSLSP